MTGKKSSHSSLLPLRAKLLLLLFALVMSVLTVAGTTLWYVSETQSLFQRMERYDIGALLSAQELEKELMAQQGLTTYYSQDHDEVWLNRMHIHNEQFENMLNQVRRSNYLDQGRDILNSIESEYIRYIYSRDEVIELYRENSRKEALELHKLIREKFQSLYGLCEQYKMLHQESINSAASVYSRHAQLLTGLSLSAIPVSVFLALCLGFILVKRILDPVRHLAKWVNFQSAFSICWTTWNMHTTCFSIAGIRCFNQRRWPRWASWRPG